MYCKCQRGGIGRHRVMNPYKEFAKALREDREMFHGYQCNIAMAFVDNVSQLMYCKDCRWFENISGKIFCNNPKNYLPKNIFKGCIHFEKRKEQK